MNTAYTSTSSEFCVVLTTVDQEDIAKSLAKSFVQNKLAACVTVLTQATSFYIWEGRLEEASEYLLLIKTHQEQCDALMAFIQEKHPYTLPELIALPIVAGSSAYLDWVKSCLT